MKNPMINPQSIPAVPASLMTRNRKAAPIIPPAISLFLNFFNQFS